LPSFLDFERFDFPFTHWVDKRFLSPEQVRELNAIWPADDARWQHERKEYAMKSALLFPNRLHDAAQALARDLYSPAKLSELSNLTNLPLLPDPWFEDGPLLPRVGGGLHEIHPGGVLKMHVDFSEHPSGLTRALNLLIYLNVEWREAWGGALELGNAEAKIYPYGGTAVIFQTTATSWHGHPHPLTCPKGKARRSLALYYYTKESREKSSRTSTVYKTR
jgi:Rps23 Pro-64 3,4-dihydroxylase Tpa1-like proline 4-hydroxylase